MTEQEAIDLEELKREIQATKVRGYEYLVALSKMTPNELQTSGYGKFSQAEAVVMALRNNEKQIKKLTDKHLAKYPD